MPVVNVFCHMSVVCSNDWVILQRFDKTFCVKVQERITYIDKIKVNLKSITGLPYGSCIVVNKDFTASAIDIKNSHIFNDQYDDLISHSGVDNSQITDTNDAQCLNEQEISSLKEDVQDGFSIVKALVENSATFHTKTAFSQAKYIKKKMKKYVGEFLLIKCDSHELCKYYYSKNTIPFRSDTLGRMMYYSQINANSKVLVFDDHKGIVVGTVLERIVNGHVLQLYNGTNAPCHILSQFSFDSETLTKKLKTLHLKHLTNNQTETQPIPIIIDVDLTKPSFDCCILATNYHPLEVFQQLRHQLMSSSPIVVFSQHMNVLVEMKTFLRHNNLAIEQSISTTFMRTYQVLDQRTHPNVNMTDAPGYLLTAIYIS